MRYPFGPFLPSFPKHLRRRMLVGVILSFLAGPIAAQILIFLLIGLG